MSTPGLKTDRFPGICRVSQYRDSTALSAHHHGEQISKRSFQPVSARPQAWPLSLDYVMSEIGRDHFLVATYEHMSLNATPTNPFSVIGVDFTRPVKYLQRKSKKEQKTYIVIYSCSLNRAVFLELLPSLDTGEFIESLKPLIARRGRLTEIYSDSGRTFIAAAN